MGSSNPADLVELFTMCFRICLAITLLAAAVAVLLFIRLDIKSVFLQMTGRKRRATIREINVAQEMTGKIGSPVQAAANPPGKDTVPLVDDVEPKTEITSILYTGTGKQKSEKPVSAGFVVTKRVVVIHTDETIDQ